jgi:hypothetical protein
MSSYVPDHRKKFRILEKRERELLHAINNEFGVDKIEKAAERVRDAKLNVYKSKLAQIPPVEGRWERREAMWKKKTLEWQSVSVVEIVDRYATGHKCDN